MPSGNPARPGQAVRQRRPQIPVRLDFDAHATDFARAMAHLDRAATKELDRVDFDPGCAS
jgi:hypothetical protein